MADPIGIEIRNLYKIFGPQASQLMDAVRKGMTKTELNDRHHHVLGLNDINISMPAGQIQVIMGLSGSGKSSLALALIDRGAELIGDDGVTLSLDGGQLLATPAPATAGLIEVRPRRGAVVATASPERLYEMFEVMAELEAMCARLAARRAIHAAARSPGRIETSRSSSSLRPSARTVRGRSISRHLQVPPALMPLATVPQAMPVPSARCKVTLAPSSATTAARRGTSRSGATRRAGRDLTVICVTGRRSSRLRAGQW